MESKPEERPIPHGGEKGTNVEDLKNEHAEVKTRKPYTKRGTKTLPDDVEKKREQFVAGLQLFSSMSLSIACKRMPNPLPPTPEEIKIWNDGVTAVSNKYFSAFANWDAELSLALAAFVVFIPRLKDPNDKPATSSDGSRKDGNGKNNAGGLPD